MRWNKNYKEPPLLVVPYLNELATGPDATIGAQVTLNDDINALLLWNNGGQDVKFSGDNSAALNAILSR